jgi:hypothetical protein
VEVENREALSGGQVGNSRLVQVDHVRDLLLRVLRRNRGQGVEPQPAVAVGHSDNGCGLSEQPVPCGGGSPSACC